MAEPVLFGPLKRSISLLIVDDDPELLFYYHEMLAGNLLYRITTAATARDAEHHLSSQMQHIIILDLGIDDIDGDEFYLLKRYGNRTPVIIVSGRADMQRAFDAATAGAAGMVAKQPDMFCEKFWNLLTEVFLTRVLLTDTTTTTNMGLTECCRVLHNYQPKNVAEWAGTANITEAYLRKLLMEAFGHPPKHLLFMYKWYKLALTYYNDRYLAEMNNRPPEMTIADFPDYHRMEEYYLLNRRKLDVVLRRKRGVKTAAIQTAILISSQ